MNIITSMEEARTFIEEHPFAFLYISKSNCSVCHALKPKVIDMLSAFPAVQFGEINTDDVPEIAGAYSIFTAPVLLFFVDGKEVIREARFVQMEILKNRMTKIYEMTKPN